jgi:hypothetical protein
VSSRLYPHRRPGVHHEPHEGRLAALLRLRPRVGRRQLPPPLPGLRLGLLVPARPRRRHGTLQAGGESARPRQPRRGALFHPPPWRRPRGPSAARRGPSCTLRRARPRPRARRRSPRPPGRPDARRLRPRRAPSPRPGRRHHRHRRVPNPACRGPRRPRPRSARRRRRNVHRRDPRHRAAHGGRAQLVEPLRRSGTARARARPRRLCRRAEGTTPRSRRRRSLLCTSPASTTVGCAPASRCTYPWRRTRCGSRARGSS